MLVVCGESLIDLISDGSSSGYVARPGGSPFNVAVGAARLGLPTALVSRFGTGSFGYLLREHAAAAGVDLSLSSTETEPATLAVVSLNPVGGAVYDFYVEGTAEAGWQSSEPPAQLPAETQVLHVGSLSSWRTPAADVIAALVTREHERGAVLISFDPNLRPALVRDTDGIPTRVERLVAKAHVVKVSAEDIACLYPDEPPDSVARRWSATGPALVVLTAGSSAVRAYRSGTLACTLPAYDVVVVDTVGAGDAFTAGLLAALAEQNQLGPDQIRDIEEHDLMAALNSAGIVAALTCGRTGADPPTRAERDAALRDPPGRRDMPAANPGRLTL